MFDPSSKSFNTHLNFPRTFDDHPDSGVCSPPLWRTSPPKSPPHPRHNTNYHNLSPVSKAQIIARGQRELMEMVSKMPESCYELSLKDLVEVNTDEEKDGKVFDELPQRNKKQSKVARKTKSDKWVDPMIRNGGVNVNNSGLLLKLVFPVSLRAKKKTKKRDEDDSSVTSKSSWLSPRPSISDSSVKPDDKDWWKDGLSESRRRSQRGVSRINSRSNSDRSRVTLRDENRGCLSFLWNVHVRD
ncbi:unnamed protein product [Microthlaspi erraticum]|uniref:Uncharacterized protein n=1 Tax=Microthlaspi erraticum TaxID=1685480 RepID=A0A6D2HCL4_9BRAS|nr:unnamed protein product [Microthlaspi erraticum]